MSYLLLCGDILKRSMPEQFTPYWPSRDKQTLYSLNRLKGMNMEQAAIHAGYTESMVNVASTKIEPKHNQSIREALVGAGVTNPRLAIAIHEALSAEKHVVVDKAIQYVTDHKTRLDAARMALEATGELKSNTAVNVVINMPQGLGELLLQDSGEYIEGKK